MASNEKDGTISGRLILQRRAISNEGTGHIGSDEWPQSFEELKTILKDRHTSVMEGRPTKRPGIFKTDPNRAATIIFVAPKLVEGTLAKGFEIYRSLTVPLHRAVFMMFLVSEVHPFDDVNGRVARLMMNAELVAANEARILVPTVYRNNYLTALKALSQSTNARALLQVLDFAQRLYRSGRFLEPGAGTLHSRSNARLYGPERS